MINYILCQNTKYFLVVYYIFLVLLFIFLIILISHSRYYLQLIKVKVLDLCTSLPSIFLHILKKKLFTW